MADGALIDPRTYLGQIGGGPVQSQGVSAADFGNVLAAGTGDLISGVGGLGELLAGEGGMSTGMRQWGQDFSQSFIDKLSPDARSRLDAEFLTTGPGSVWTEGPLSSLALKFTRSVPSTAAAMLPGGILARGALAAGGIAGAIEGGLAAGDIFNGIRQEIENAPEEELLKSQRYREMREQGMADPAARTQLVREVGANPALIGGITTGLLSTLGETAVFAALGKGGAGAASRTRAIGRGALGEATTESLQSGQESYQQQAGAGQATGRGIDPGQIAEQMAQGGAVGAAMGGGIAGTFYRRPQRPGTTADAGNVPDPAIAAAIAARGPPQQGIPAPPAGEGYLGEVIPNAPPSLFADQQAARELEARRAQEALAMGIPTQTGAGPGRRVPTDIDAPREVPTGARPFMAAPDTSYMREGAVFDPTRALPAPTDFIVDPQGGVAPPGERERRAAGQGRATLPAGIGMSPQEAEQRVGTFFEDAQPPGPAPRQPRPARAVMRAAGGIPVPDTAAVLEAGRAGKIPVGPRATLAKPPKKAAGIRTDLQPSVAVSAFQKAKEPTAGLARDATVEAAHDIAPEFSDKGTIAGHSVDTLTNALFDAAVTQSYGDITPRGLAVGLRRVSTGWRDRVVGTGAKQRIFGSPASGWIRIPEGEGSKRLGDFIERLAERVSGEQSLGEHLQAAPPKIASSSGVEVVGRGATSKAAAPQTDVTTAPLSETAGAAQMHAAKMAGKLSGEQRAGLGSRLREVLQRLVMVNASEKPTGGQQGVKARRERGQALNEAIEALAVLKQGPRSKGQANAAITGAIARLVDAADAISPKHAQRLLHAIKSGDMARVQSELDRLERSKPVQTAAPYVEPEVEPEPEVIKTTGTVEPEVKEVVSEKVQAKAKKERAGRAAAEKAGVPYSDDALRMAADLDRQPAVAPVETVATVATPEAPAAKKIKARAAAKAKAPAEAAAPKQPPAMFVGEGPLYGTAAPDKPPTKAEKIKQAAAARIQENIAPATSEPQPRRRFRRKKADQLKAMARRDFLIRSASAAVGTGAIVTSGQVVYNAEISKRLQAQLEKQAELAGPAATLDLYHSPTDLRLQAGLEEGAKNRTGIKLRTLLQEIEDHHPNGLLREQARQLLGVGTPNILVGTQDFSYNPMDEGSAGTTFIDPKTRQIMGMSIRTRGAIHNVAQTIIHEAFHAQTAERLQYWRRIGDPRFKMWVDLLSVYRQELASGQKTGRLQMRFTQEYGQMNVDEFLVAMMNEPDVQARALAMRVPRELLQRINGSVRPRSMWQTFVGLVKKTLGMENVSDSVLDAALRLAHETIEAGPLQGLERAMTMNADSAPASLAKLNRIMGDWRSESGAVGAGRRLRDLLLGALTTRQMVEQHAPSFGPVTDPNAPGSQIPFVRIGGGTNPMEDFGRDLQAMSSTAHRKQEAGDRLYGEWLNMAKADPASANAFNNFLLQSTMNSVHLDRPETDPSNVAAKQPLQQANYRRLKPEFDALVSAHPEWGKLYDNLRKYFHAERMEQRRKLFDNILRRTAAGPQPINTVKDIDNLAVGEGIKRHLKRVLVATNETQFYAPLRRFGDWVVSVRQSVDKVMSPAEAASFAERFPGLRDLSQKPLPNGDVEVKGEVQHTRHFENESEATQHAATLRAQPEFKGVDIGVQLRRDLLKLDTGITADINRDIANELRKTGASQQEIDDVSRLLTDAMIRFFPDTFLTKSDLDRRNIAGASGDMLRSFATYNLSNSYYQASLEHGWKLGEDIAAMQKVTDKHGYDATGRQPVMQQVVDEMRRRHELQQTHRSPNALIQTAADVGMVWYLASPSYWMLNALQPFMVGLPMMSARFGARRSASALSRAMAMVSPDVLRRSGKAFGRGLAGKLTPADFNLTEQLMENIRTSRHPQAAALVKMLDRLAGEGLLDLSFAMDTREGARGHTPTPEEAATMVGKAGRKVRASLRYFADMTRMMPHGIEIVNRSATAIATYELAIAKGMNVEQATEAAIDMVAKTQFDYSNVNKARYMNPAALGGAARLVLMFKQYAQHMYYLMVSNAYNAVKGKSAQEKAEARKALAGLLFSHGLMAGAIGMTFEPIKLAIGMTMALFSGADDPPFDFDVEARQFLANLFGPAAGEIIARGLPRALGIDVSTRTGLDQMLTFGMAEDLQKDQGLFLALGKALAGPVGSAIYNLAWEAPKAMREGDPLRALEFATPKGLRDVIRAYRFDQEGILDRNGNRIDQTAELGPLDLFIQSLGFTPSEVSELYEKRTAIKNVESAGNERRQMLLERYWRADDKGNAWSDIQNFNEKNPVFRISRAQLVKSMEARRRRERETREGIYLPKTRRGLREEGSFSSL